MNQWELTSVIREKQSFLCVGLDPDIQKIPSHLQDFEDPLFEFNRRIVDATRDYCVAYKPNLAFYECLGSKGWDSLAKILDYIPETHFTIADAKRGDIGNTAEKYAETFFKYLNFDAVTLSPYMGQDTIQPFLQYEGKWAIVLVHTSNTGARDFQRLTITANGRRLYMEVLEQCLSWGSMDQLMFVVGANNTEALQSIRQSAPDHFLLVPGFGAQGGTLEDITPFISEHSVGILANYSRQIIYADHTETFDSAAGFQAATIAGAMSGLLN